MSRKNTGTYQPSGRRGWPVDRTAVAVGSRNLQEPARKYCPWLCISYWNPFRLRNGGCQIPFYIESYIRLFSSSTLPAKVYLHTAYTIHPRNIHSSHLSNHLLQEVFNPLQIVNNQFMVPYI